MVVKLFPVQIGWQDTFPTFNLEIERPNTLKR